MGEIISFYSYKGGVGRSMALANLATLLAQRGHRVLVVDFDLEAPGLHRYFLGPAPNFDTPRQSPSSGQRGVIDLFVELRRNASENRGPAHSIVASLLDSGDFGYSVRVGFPGGARSASLDFLSAGRFDEGYAERVHDFPWSRFYEERSEIFSSLTDEWKKRYHYVLLDSRTGISDLGSVSTLILADKLVLAFTPNQQSLHGVSEFGRQAVELERQLSGVGSLRLFPLLSRVDEGEQLLKRHWTADAVTRFESLFKDAYGQCDINFSAYFDAVHIPHRGYYAYGEKIAVEEERTATLGSLAEGYSRFLDCLMGETLAGWQDRIENAVRPRHEDGALVVNFDASLALPQWISSDRVVSVPSNLPRHRLERLRAFPVDEDAWHAALTEIDLGLEKALHTITGALHVFAALPYPAAVYLGRRLDDLARARLVHVYQSYPTQGWNVIAGLNGEPSHPAEPFYHLLKQTPSSSKTNAVLLAVEGVSPFAQKPLDSLANNLGAQVYRLGGVRRGFLRPDEISRAAIDLHQALLHIQAQHPDLPLHVVATAPIALLIEMGRMLSPNVYRSVIVYQFIPESGRYVPVLDVIHRAVLGASDVP